MRKNIGYVPEEQNFYKSLTVLEYLNFIAKFTLFDDEERISSLNFLMDYFDFLRYENKTIESLSKGTKQKILICSSLLIKPKLLLLDEPMVNLDPITRIKLIDLLKKFKSSGVPELNISEPGSFIMISHDLNSIFDLCDRIIVISDQKIILNKNSESAKNSFNIRDYVEYK